MKKLGILMMPLMAISLLASCGNNNPEPQPTDEYTVNEQEMKDALAMKDVEYLQINGQEEDSTSTIEFTPTSFHMLNAYSSKYEEILIIKDGDNYYQYERSSEEEPLKPTEYEGQFMKPSEYAEFFFVYFKDKNYTDFYYNKEKKEYMCYYIPYPAKISIGLFQFNNKKVVKFTDVHTISSTLEKLNYTLTYDKIEPPSPTI